jgi:hypothetical protein
MGGRAGPGQIVVVCSSRLWSLLADVVAPFAQGFDDLGQDGGGERHAEEDERLVYEVGNAQLSPNGWAGLAEDLDMIGAPWIRTSIAAGACLDSHVGAQASLSQCRILSHGGSLCFIRCCASVGEGEAHDVPEGVFDDSFIAAYAVCTEQTDGDEADGEVEGGEGEVDTQGGPAILARQLLELLGERGGRVWAAEVRRGVVVAWGGLVAVEAQGAETAGEGGAVEAQGGEGAVVGCLW